MASLFGRKKSAEKIIKEQQREMARTDRQLQRDRAKLENEEKQLIIQIKRSAEKGDKTQAQALAKQLVRVRQQREKSFGASAKIQGISGEMSGMASNIKVANVMHGATKAMTATNKAMNPQKIQKTMMSFERQNQQMEMTGEMMNDTIEGVMDDDEEESEEVMNQVLDEIGIDLNQKMVDAPTSKLRGKAAAEEEEDLDALTAQLAGLRQ